jgi:type I restriction enzyme S subunit
VLRIPNIQQKLNLDSMLHLKISSSQINEEVTASKNTIILVGSNGNPDRVGNAIIIDNDSNYLFASFLIAGKIKQPLVAHPKYLFHIISSPPIQDAITKSVQGTTGLKNLSIRFLESLEFHNVVLVEQRSIAAILDNVDEAIRQTEAVITKLRQVKTGMLHDLLTCGLDENGEIRDPIRHPEQFKDSPLGRIPKEWEVNSFDSVCEKIQDGTHFSPTSTFGPCMYITSKNIRFGFMELTNVGWISIKEHDAIYKRCDVKPGDVLLTKDGANTGNAAINTIDKPFSLLSSVALLRCNEKKLHNMFLLQTLLSPLFQKNINDSMSGNAITRLTLNKIKEFQFAIPPLQEQYLISKSLANIQGKIDVEARLSGKLIIIKHGLMHDLLTGTVRVPANLLEATP